MITNAIRARMRHCLLLWGCLALFVSTTLAFAAAGNSPTIEDETWDAERLVKADEDFFASDETRYFDDESDTDSPRDLDEEDSPFSSPSSAATGVLAPVTNRPGRHGHPIPSLTRPDRRCLESISSCDRRAK